MQWWKSLLHCLRRQPASTSSPDPAVRAVLDEFWPMFVNSRSLCGYLPEEALGARSFSPGPFYEEGTPYLRITLKEPLTPEVREAHNRIGGWTNQNGLIRLWAVLESHGFTKPIRRGAAESETVSLLKRLRQHYAHGSGLYDDHKRDHRKLRRDLLKAFPVPGDPTGIPLDINRVLAPLFAGCRRYVDDVLRAES